PLSLIINCDYGWAFYCARRYDEAVDQLRRTLEMDANFAQAYLWLGLVRLVQGSFRESAEAFETGARLTGGSPTMLAGLALTRASDGDRGQAERMLAEMEEKAKTGYVPMATMVQLHLALGNVDGSFEWLERAAGRRSEGNPAEIARQSGRRVSLNLPAAGSGSPGKCFAESNAGDRAAGPRAGEAGPSDRRRGRTARPVPGARTPTA
ncbi:MAG: hypothetical protein DMF55_11085, partial [Acidobacteria bacterium]